MEGFPFAPLEELRVLGVQFDRYVQLDTQFEHLLAEARVRQGILARVSGSSWGMEAGLLRMSHDALIGSPWCMFSS